jgi:hypothetical protein
LLLISPNRRTPNDSTKLELAFQRIEAQTSGSILLSRQIGTPNIASKGKLEPRTVQIPRILYPEGHLSRGAVGEVVDGVAGVGIGADVGGGGKGKGKKLIEEIREGEKGKGILKTPTKSVSSKVEVPSWTWSKTSTKIKIIINVPKLVRPPLPPP